MKKKSIFIRIFLFFFIFLPATVDSFAQDRDNVVSQAQIPGWVKQEIDTVYEKVINYIAGQEAVVFPILTDLHLTSSGAYNHIDYAVYASRLLTFDFIVNLGDIGLDVGTNTPEAASRLMRDVYDRHSGFQGITLYAKGNHDANSVYQPISDTEWATRFLIPQARKSESFQYHKTYSYYDIKRTKTRVIVLNTSDGKEAEKSNNFYCLSDEQLNWLVASLQFKEKDWHVVLLTHYCPDKIGEWNGYPSGMINNDILDAILNGFKNNTSGKIRNISWNFSKNKSNDFVANFCGDSHFDNYIKHQGINRIITQGYGGVSEPDLPSGAKKWNRGNDMVIDIVVIKPLQKEFQLFRLGAGEDRFFTF